MVKNLPARRHGFHPWVEKIRWVGNGNPLQYSCLENPRQKSLVSYSPRGSKRVKQTEQLSTHRYVFLAKFLY